MNFLELVYSAKLGDDIANKMLYEMYYPLLMKESIVNGVFDEDLFQEQCIVFLKCVKIFKD